MSANWDFLENVTEQGLIDFAVEELAVSVQLALQKAMQRREISKKKLAELLDVSPARVTQMLGDGGSNLTLKSIAKIAHALAENFEFISHYDLAALKRNAINKAENINKAEKSKIIPVDYPLAKLSRLPQYQWEDHTANDNKFPQKVAA